MAALTKRGKLIYEFFKQHPSLHPTAEEIYNDLKTNDTHLGIATVYRNLKSLVDEGVLKEMNIEKQGVRYDLHEEQHDHFICDSCGQIQNIVLDSFYDVKKEIEKTTHGIITDKDILIHGICEHCLHKKPI